MVKHLAIPKGYLYIDILKKDYPLINILEVSNLMSAIESLLERKADLLLDSHSVIGFLLEKHGITTIYPFKVLPLPKPQSIYMAVVKKQSLLANIIDKAIEAISEDKRQQLQRKWFDYQIPGLSTRIILSQDEQKWLDQHPKIRFIGDPNWLPYEAFDEKNKYIGIVAEHLKLVEKKLGIKIDIVPAKSWRESVS
jgi:two-component system sensor histidine kinase EvgS